jgi:hypothetical protein
MFPTTITINNISDLQKVMSVLYPTTGVIEIADKSRDTVDLQAVVNKAEAKVATGKSQATSAATQADDARSQPTAEEAAETAAPEKTAAASAPTAASAETAQQASTAATDASAITYKDVQAAVVAAVKAGKRSNVVDLLTEFGVNHAEKLTPEQWPGALARLKGMVA